MLDGHDDGAALADFGLGGEGDVDAGGQRYNRRDRRLWWGSVFVVAEHTRVEDALSALIVLDRGIAEVDCGFGGTRGEFGGVFVEVIEVVLGKSVGEGQITMC